MGKIFLSAGHGGFEDGERDPGAIGTGTTEALEMIRIRDATVQSLSNSGVEVVAVPDNLSLGQSIRFINDRAVAGDVALEIHADSATPQARGATAFFVLNNADREKDARMLLDKLLEKLPGLKDRGARPDTQTLVGSLGFCRKVKVPSVLMELGFITNPEDLALMQGKRDRYAAGLTAGLTAWLGQQNPTNAQPDLAPRLNLRINGVEVPDKGLLLNGNSFLPIALVERLGFDLSALALARKVESGGIVYLKAIELKAFGVELAFDGPSKTLDLKTRHNQDIDKSGTIMSLGRMSADALKEFLKDRNSAAMTQFPNLPTTYIDEARAEGVNHDLAFCQMCLETGFLRFGGQVDPQQNNFCGLGALDGGAKGASFASVRDGIRAHIQHLKAYASGEPLVHPKIDPRFDLVLRGVAPTVFDLSGRWASDPRYGEKIMSILESLVESSRQVPVG